jgi:hypothetical protein
MNKVPKFRDVAATSDELERLETDKVSKTEFNHYKAQVEEAVGKLIDRIEELEKKK